MTDMNILWVFLGGGLGSVLRYGINNLIGSSHNFPLATLMANFLSSLALGVLFGMSGNDLLSDRQKLIFMTGFCGGFSTFSTFSWGFLFIFVFVMTTFGFISSSELNFSNFIGSSSF